MEDEIIDSLRTGTDDRDSVNEAFEEGVYTIGQRVEFRDEEEKAWRTGIVTKAGSDPYINPDAWARDTGYRWHHVRTIEEVKINEYTSGQRVEFRDEGKAWRTGIVTKGGSDPYINPDTWARDTGYRWDEVRPLTMEEKKATQEVKEHKTHTEVEILEENLVDGGREVSEAGVRGGQETTVEGGVMVQRDQSHPG